MKNTIIYLITAYILLHLATLVSFIPGFFTSLSLEESHKSHEQIELATMFSLKVGFIIATYLSVIILYTFFKLIDKRKKLHSAIILALSYLTISIVESSSKNFMFTIAGSAYSRVFKNYVPYIIIPLSFLFVVLFYPYVKNLKEKFFTKI